MSKVKIWPLYLAVSVLSTQSCSVLGNQSDEDEEEPLLPAGEQAETIFPVTGIQLGTDNVDQSLSEEVVTLKAELSFEKERRIEEVAALQKALLEQAERLNNLEARFAALASENSLSEKDLTTTQDQNTSVNARSVQSTDEAVSESVSGRVHTVRTGETLGGISLRYGARVNDIVQANSLRSADFILAGQRLLIPDNGTENLSLPEKAIENPQQVAVALKEPANQPQPVRQPPSQEAPVRQQKATLPEAVGERPTEEYREPTVAVLSDVGGILTPDGTFYVEPQLTFSASSDNRFFFNGVEIVDSLLIGIINATDTDRTSATFAQGLRYGLTNRIEVDATVPFVAQENRISGVQIDGQNGGELRDLSNSGIGDVAAGIHVQLNDGKKFPYTIANLRVKAPTGDGPFDIDPATDTPTGSGYWTVEPSLTFIQPADPAVLYANVGYQYNMEQDINRFIGGNGTPRAFYRSSDPGDAIRTSFGVGVSLNDDLSINFGYDQSYIFSSRFELSAEEELSPDNPLIISEGQEVTIGSFLFGLSYNPTRKLGFSMNTNIGATDEAPDATISLKARYRLFD